jgi:predicted HTH transcriptional regulator
MQCDRCKENIEVTEEREHHGQMLCEDCYMDALSPAKACDPWAVFTAKSFSKADGSGAAMTETQSKILQILKETGGAAPEIISEKLQIKPADLEREIATLRHMEKVRGELKAGKKILHLW